MARLRTSFPWPPEKAAATAAAVAPILWLAFLACGGGLGARPVTEAIRFSGDWALRLLWIVLLIGPARRVLGAPRLIRARRILGVGVFGLAAVHFGLYASTSASTGSRSRAKPCCASIWPSARSR